jgi:hypothetical protein
MGAVTGDEPLCMRIAVQSPHFLFEPPERSFTGYDRAFALEHAAVIYLPGWRNWVRRGKGYRELLKAHGVHEERFEFAFTPRELNRKADVLVCFNYMPHGAGNEPPRHFRGLKVWHTMDFVFNAGRANKALESGGVTAVMGYCDHSRHNAYFRVAYPRYFGRVIAVPFGFAPRFSEGMASESRISKVIALGSVNPVAEKGLPKAANLDGYARFYPNATWTHSWRRRIVENLHAVTDLVDSQLPIWPETKNPSYDAVALMKQYAMFLNDEGLMAFPPARTYEGPAAGALLVGNRHPCYADFGFRDGVNCVLHEPGSLQDFRQRVQALLAEPRELERLAAASCEFVRSRYSHTAIGNELHQRLTHLWQGREAAAFANWAE